MTLMFPLDLLDRQVRLDRLVRLDFHQDGLQLLHLLVREKVATGNTVRERLHPRCPPRKTQLIPFATSDGDVDQPPQDGRRRQRSRSRDRVHP